MWWHGLLPLRAAAAWPTSSLPNTAWPDSPLPPRVAWLGGLLHPRHGMALLPQLRQNPVPPPSSSVTARPDHLLCAPKWHGPAAPSFPAEYRPDPKWRGPDPARRDHPSRTARRIQQGAGRWRLLFFFSWSISAFLFFCFFKWKTVAGKNRH